MIRRRKLLLLPLLTVVVAAGWLMNPSSAHASSTGNLIYHGGPVMPGNMKAYVIFWEPSGSFVSSTYNELLQRYFRDIGDSGLYANNQQYTQTDGRAPMHAKLAGTFVDTSPYPSAPFLQDADLRHEIMHAMSVQGWKPGINHAFFIYTALHEFICAPALFFGGVCSAPNSPQCAYHFAFGTPDGVVLYGAMPYAGNALAHCGGLSLSPNHDIDADAEINLTSHEQMEVATDPLATGWFDATGLTGEIGDKCAGVYGSLDATGADVYINGHPYIVQEEWDNAVSGCAISGP